VPDSPAVPPFGTQELFTKLGSEVKLGLSSFGGRADQTKAPHDSSRSWALSFMSVGVDMNLFSKGPNHQGIKVGLTTVLAMAVLIATVTFYRVFRYFPA
jgi:hypothetical protein